MDKEHRADCPNSPTSKYKNIKNIKKKYKNNLMDKEQRGQNAPTHQHQWQSSVPRSRG